MVVLLYNIFLFINIHGNVKSLVQELPALQALGQRFKRIDHDYDLVSGKVNEVKYQKGQADAFFHRYDYDADNRIRIVLTSKEGTLWDKDASYGYYKHGPLARMELGDSKIQGMDYAYTLQGWIKGVNSNTLYPTRDIGKDGTTGTHSAFALDEAGFTLGYYAGDYSAIGSSGATHFEARPNAALLAKPLFNGNISHIVTGIGKLMSRAVTSGLPTASPLGFCLWL